MREVRAIPPVARARATTGRAAPAAIRATLIRCPSARTRKWTTPGATVRARTTRKPSGSSRRGPSLLEPDTGIASVATMAATRTRAMGARAEGRNGCLTCDRSNEPAAGTERHFHVLTALRFEEVGRGGPDAGDAEHAA